MRLTDWEEDEEWDEGDWEENLIEMDKINPEELREILEFQDEDLLFDQEGEEDLEQNEF
jgi:hypothetical protein